MDSLIYAKSGGLGKLFVYGLSVLKAEYFVHCIKKSEEFLCRIESS